MRNASRLKTAGNQDNTLRAVVTAHKEFVPSFNAAGGDGYPKLTGHPGFVNTGFVDAEVLKDFLEANSPVDVNKFAPSGEIVYK